MGQFDYPFIRFHPDDRDLLLNGADGDRWSNQRYLLDLGWRFYAIRSSNPDNKPLKRFDEDELPLLFSGFRATDGDTIWHVLEIFEGIFTVQPFRTLDANTPEKKTKAGKLVTDVATDWHIRNLDNLRAESTKLDNFGRTLGTAYSPLERYSQFLLDGGFALPYPQGIRPPWTRPQLQAIEQLSLRYLGME